MARKQAARAGKVRPDAVGKKPVDAPVVDAPVSAVVPAADATEPGVVPNASCTWTPTHGFDSSTKKGGAVTMFGDGGHRAADLMLLSLGACLNYFLVDYAKGRDLPVTAIRVTCSGEWSREPDRLSKIVTRVVIDGDIDDAERRRMVDDCERIWKVMNTIRYQPECSTLLLSPSGEEIA